MQHRNAWSVTGALLVLAALATTACSPTYVVVPQRPGDYTAQDTLHGRLKDRDVRVTFRHDTTWRVDTVVRWRTIYREGSRVDTIVAVVFDTVRVGRNDRRGPRDPRDQRDPRRGVDTVVVVVHDTVRVGGGRRPGQQVDTVRIVVHDTIVRSDPRRRVDTVRVVVHDTVRVPGPGGPGRPGTPGGPIILPQRPADRGVDTVRVTIHDTVRVTFRDTVRITVRDTLRLPGHRVLHVPPGQFPPTGQCRVWIVDLPPGQQAEPAACNALGAIPAGAFILFRGEAWDFDYDWLGDPSAPPEIIALRHPGRSTAPRPAPNRLPLPGGRRP